MNGYHHNFYLFVSFNYVSFKFASGFNYTLCHKNCFPDFLVCGMTSLFIDHHYNSYELEVEYFFDKECISNTIINLFPEPSSYFILNA